MGQHGRTFTTRREPNNIYTQCLQPEASRLALTSETLYAFIIFYHADQLWPNGINFLNLKLLVLWLLARGVQYSVYKAMDTSNITPLKMYTANTSGNNDALVFELTRFSLMEVLINNVQLKWYWYIRLQSYLWINSQTPLYIFGGFEVQSSFSVKQAWMR